MALPKPLGYPAVRSHPAFTTQVGFITCMRLLIGHFCYNVNCAHWTDLGTSLGSAGATFLLEVKCIHAEITLLCLTMYRIPLQTLGQPRAGSNTLHATDAAVLFDPAHHPIIPFSASTWFAFTGQASTQGASWHCLQTDIVISSGQLRKEFCWIYILEREMDSVPWWVLAFVQLFKNNLAEWIAEVERAITLNPNSLLQMDRCRYL